MTIPKGTTHYHKFLSPDDPRRYEKWTKVKWKVTSYTVETWSGKKWIPYGTFSKMDNKLKTLRSPIGDLKWTIYGTSF